MGCEFTSFRNKMVLDLWIMLNFHLKHFLKVWEMVAENQGWYEHSWKTAWDILLQQIGTERLGSNRPCNYLSEGPNVLTKNSTGDESCQAKHLRMFRSGANHTHTRNSQVPRGDIQRGKWRCNDVPFLRSPNELSKESVRALVRQPVLYIFNFSRWILPQRIDNSIK